MTNSSNGWGKLGVWLAFDSQLPPVVIPIRHTITRQRYGFIAGPKWVIRQQFGHRAGERRHAPAVFGADTSLNMGQPFRRGALG
jgi:hypothetical protein